MGARLLEGERVRAVARPHWIVLARPLAPTPLVAIVVAALVLGLGRWPPVAELRAPVALGALALLGAWIGGAYLRWTSQAVLVTNRRAVLQVGLVNRRRTMVALERIQDVTTEQGLLGRLLGFGTVVVATAGWGGERTPGARALVLANVCAPERLARWLFPPAAEGVLDAGAAFAPDARLPPAAGDRR